MREIAGDVELTKKIISIAPWITLEINGETWTGGMRKISTQAIYDNYKQIRFDWQ